MGLFSRRPSQGRPEPTDLVGRLEAYGRFSLDPSGSGVAPSSFGDLEYELYVMAQADLPGTVAMVSAVGLREGGWAAVGACRALRSVAEDCQHDGNYIRVLDAALEAMHAEGVPASSLAPAESERWARSRGEW